MNDKSSKRRKDKNLFARWFHRKASSTLFEQEFTGSCTQSSSAETPSGTLQYACVQDSSSDTARHLQPAEPASPAVKIPELHTHQEVLQETPVQQKGSLQEHNSASTANQHDGVFVSDSVNDQEKLSSKRCLHAQVIQAKDVPAADSNGLSDPYCIVHMGDRKVSTRVELKTLCPHWNELFVFSNEDLEEAIQDGHSRVLLMVYDWDMVSADDFLGQAEIQFAEISAKDSHPTAVWLPLHRTSRSGRQKEKGQIQVAMWFEEAAEGLTGPSGGLSSLCSPPGFPKRVPLVVHAGGNSLYEEPLIACLGITLEGVQGVTPGTSASSAHHATTSSGGGEGQDSTEAWSSSSRSKRPNAMSRLMHRLKRKNPRNLARVGSLGQNSMASEWSAFAEDDEDLQLMLGGTSLMDESFICNSDEEQTSLQQSVLEGEGQSSAAPPNLVSNTEAESNLECTVPTNFEETVEDAQALSGSLMYCKLSLGRQMRTSFVRKERSDGSAVWQQRFVFACPVPVKNRKIVVGLYRTPATTRKGRLVASTQVWLYDLFPQLSNAQPVQLPPQQKKDTAGGEREQHHPGVESKAAHRSHITLQSLDKRVAGGQVCLSCVVVDQDERRMLYQAPLSDNAHLPASVLPSHKGAAAVDSEEAGPGMVRRLQSSTHVMGESEMKRRAELTEEGYDQWENSWHHRVAQRARRMASHQAEYYRVVLSNLASSAAVQLGWSPAPSNYAALAQGSGFSGTQASSQATNAGRTAPPQPPASLHLAVSSLSIPGCTQDCFVVIKCGPHWGRTAASSPAPNGTYTFSWELSVPVHDPSTLLLVTIFSKPRRTPFHSLGQAQGGAGRQAGGMPQMLGKLRVRLCCVWPNEPLVATLPLLSERKKGAQQVGTADVQLQLSYISGKALLKSYLRPPLPEAAYSHGLADGSLQEIVRFETRRIILRWLDAANPPIPKAVATAVLDTEREEFLMSRLKANFRRFQLMAVGLEKLKKWWNGIERWEDPVESGCVCAALVLLAYFPSAILPLLLGWAALRTATRRPLNVGRPPEMEHDPAELVQEEQLELATTSNNPYTLLMTKYQMLVRIMLKVQNYADDMATALEKLQALGTWQDPVASSMWVGVLLLLASLIFLLGFSSVVAFALFWLARPPRLRTPTPPPPFNIFRRLPSRADKIM